MKDAGEAAAVAANTKHSSSPFRVELEVTGSDNVEDDPHLQEIRIAARIKLVAPVQTACTFLLMNFQDRQDTTERPARVP